MLVCYSETDFVQQRAACTTFPSSPPGPHDGFCWKSHARCPGTVRVLWCHVAIWHPPVKKQKAARGVLTHWPFSESLHTHTERNRKEEDQGHMAAHSGMAGLNALPYFTETLGDCCHPLLPMWAPVVWLQEREEDFPPVTHCLAAANTIFVFLWDTRGLLTAPHGMSYTSSSIPGDATSFMED